MALTELRSTLSNFRKPMAQNPLEKKGKDKVMPVKASQEDETLSKTSNLAPTSSNKNDNDLTNTKFKSQIKTVKLGVFTEFVLPKLLNLITSNKNEASNVNITKTTQGTNNNTSNTNTISVVQDKLKDIINSSLNIDNIPVKYTVSGKLETDISNLNLDTTIKYDGISKLTSDISNLNLDYVPPKYIVTPSLLQFGTVGPGLSIGASNLDIDSIPIKYQVSGKLLTDISQLNVDSIPNKYQNIVNLGQFNPFNANQSKLDVDSIPIKYQVSGKLLTDISKLNIDSIPTKYQNLVNLGEFVPFNPVQSKLDIDVSPQKYTNLIGTGQFSNDSTIIGNRWKGAKSLAPAVNFFKPDLSQGATGFSTFMDATKFIGISGTSYVFSEIIQKPLTNGVAKLSSQLGLGSVFQYTDKGALKTKPFTVAGYSAANRYGDVVKSNKNNPNDSLLYKLSTEENSPSALDLQYAKFNLQDDSYNPWYIPQPYVLRGLQAKGKKELQRWGGSALADEGLIRGGMAASVERSTFDLVRLSQWIASPKGLLWTAKQVGLGLSNPKVETGVPLPIGQTRVHSGVTSLLSVPTTAFGLHFTRHGLPFANEVASYGAVQEFNKLASNPILQTNRLVKLKAELIDSIIPGFTGQPILQLSGIGGPNSVYGIGTTIIRRFENTHSSLGLVILPYVGGLSGYNSSTKITGPATNVETVDTDTRSLKSKTEENTDNSISIIPSTNIDGVDKPNPFSRKFDIKPNTGTDQTIDKSPYTDIRKYQTLAYNKIPKRGKVSEEGGFIDFRKEIGSSNDNQAFLGDHKNANYKQNNIEKWGWGNQGLVGQYRSDVKKSTDNGDRVNQIDFLQKTKLSTDFAKGRYDSDIKDFVAFYFAGPKHHMDGNGDDVMIFRANIQGFTDSFSPEWNPINIMGRADKAYIYTGFERSVSFTFTVAATSRDEMKPMWRKINYLSTYTMPDYNESGRMVGPFMRITLGNMFQNTPGFIESLSVSIPDEATWEINLEDDNNMFKLPMMAEISITFKVLADYRPQKLGRSYSLSSLGQHGSKIDNNEDNWLSDSSVSTKTKQNNFNNPDITDEEKRDK